MQTLIWIVTLLIALGALILICLLLNMVRTGDYSALVGSNPGAGQRNENVQSRPAPASTFGDLADILLLRREPEVAHFSEDPLELTDGAQRKKISEDLVKIRKRAG